MNKQELFDSLRTAMVEVSFERVKIVDISLESKIIDELGFDSLDFAELMLHCETITNHKIDESMVNWREIITVKNLIDLFNVDAN
jgi:acyl carrier protein